MKLAVKTLDNKDAGEVTLDKDVFGVEIRQDIIHSMVQYQMNKRRGGNHKTKDVSEVSGTGKKPHSQKGTGNARAGQKRRPQTVGGGIAHGPVVRSHTTEMPKKIRKLALRKAERWMLERFEGTDGLAAIFPAMLNSLIALKAMGYFKELSELSQTLVPSLKVSATTLLPLGLNNVLNAVSAEDPL